MILRLVHAGAPTRGPLDEAANDYVGRLRRHLRVEERFVRPVKGREDEAALKQEAQRLLKAVGPRDRLVVLAVGGEPWSSELLARRLKSWRSAGHAAICFALGSAAGLGRSVHERAAERWSFGPMTLPHDLARVVMWEQLYRAQSILMGAPYHK